MSKMIWSGVCISVLLMMTAACAGEEKPALKTTKDAIKIPTSTVEFSLVQLPAGKITLKDKEGKEKEFEIKAIWMGKTEVTWDEFDIFWLRNDLTQAQRQGIRESNDPQEPKDEWWYWDGGHVGFRIVRED